MAKRRRRAHRDYEALIAKQLKSGLSVSAFARREGVPTSTLFQWKRRLRGKKLGARAASSKTKRRLLPVRVAKARTGVVSAGAEFEVKLRSGREIRVPRDFDPGALRALIEVLEE